MEDFVLKTLEELKKKKLIPEYEKYEERIMEVLKKVAENEKTTRINVIEQMLLLFEYDNKVLF
jgi:predicted ribosome-associated RNA-binding protein Tma20